MTPDELKALLCEDLDPLPDWVPPILESMSSRWRKEPSGGSYPALPTNPRLAAELFDELRMVMYPGAPLPVIVPLGDGGLQAEWERPNSALIITVSAKSSPDFYFYEGRDIIGHEHAWLGGTFGLVGSETLARLRHILRNFPKNEASPCPETPTP